MKLLHIDSSVLGDNSVTRHLTARTVAEWKAAHPGTTVEHLDLAVDSPTHLNVDSLGFKLGLAEASLTDAQRRENAVSERLVQQFLAADVVVIGAPMYNFSIPSQLKAWIDRLAQPGRTFSYTEKGPTGLAGGKTVFIASGRGGVYSTSDAARAMDHQESYLQTVFGFFGVTDVRFVRAEGLAMGADKRDEAVRQGEEAIRKIIAESKKPEQAQELAAA